MGTALAFLLARTAGSVHLWGRDADRMRALATTRENARHLPGAKLPEKVIPTDDAGEALRGADLIVVAIPTAFLRETLGRIADQVDPGTPALSVVKGIELSTFLRPSQIVAEVLGERPVSILSGPSHAEEIVRDLPASVVVAGEDEELNRRVQEALNTGRFRVYTNPDAVGVELAGALKNILGVASGICEGLGFGDNAKAALLTRGLVEIARFGEALGAQSSTFAGLAGLGDVVTTCYSPFGRNRSVGIRVGQGERLEAIQASMPNVAEGVYTSRSVHDQAHERGVEMPITDEVYQILFENKPPMTALTDLMLRPPKDELP